MKGLFVFLVAVMFASLAGVSAGSNTSVVSGPQSESITSAEGIYFPAGHTSLCPGPDNVDIWQCYDIRVGDEDIFIYQQDPNPDEPGLAFYSTDDAMQAQIMCGGEPLTLNSSNDGAEVGSFSFSRKTVDGNTVSLAVVGIPNSNEVAGGAYTGQLLSCADWYYWNTKVYPRPTGNLPLRATLVTEGGSTFQIAILIPRYWADGDLDEDTIPQPPPSSTTTTQPPTTTTTQPPIGGGECQPFADVTYTEQAKPECEDLLYQTVFAPDIEWLSAEGVTKGCNPPVNDMFCPKDYVTRGQMAAFLVRALGYSDVGTGDLFIDDDTSVFEGDIDRLGTAGVTKGCNPPVNDEFCPNARVTRGQMAAFLVRALGYSDDGGGNLFIDDDGSVFEGDIDRLGTAGVTRGCNPPVNDEFCPNSFVTREQMAAFLHRALG